MTKDLKHYLFLIAFLSIGLTLFLIFNYNRQVQMGINLVMAGGYIIWGMIHHAIKREFHLRIILEYVTVAVVASVVVTFLLLRS